MSKRIYTDFEFQGGAGVTGLPEPTSPSDAVTLSYVQGLVEGLTWKQSCRVASTAAITISAPGAAIDGVTLEAGDRVLLKNQASAAQNGIYDFVAADQALVRSVDADTFIEFEAAIISVEEGTANAGTTWRQTQNNGAISVDDLLFVPFGVVTPDASIAVAGKVELATQVEVDDGTAVGGTGANLVVTPDKLAAWPNRAKRYAATIGNGTDASIQLTHNLGTRDVVISIYDSATYEEITADVVHTSVNAVTIGFSSAPAAGAYRVVVIG